MTELEKYKKALAVARVAIADLSGADNRAYTGSRCIEANDLIDAILNPPVETEDVPVSRWAVVRSNGKISMVCETEKEAVERSAMDGASVVKLTGTLTRPKPVPVEKSMTVEFSLNGFVWREDGTCANEVLGKRGTFTWAE